MWAMANEQFKKPIGQNEAGATERLFLEKQFKESSKFITEHTSGAMETKGRTMAMGVTKIEKV